MIITPTGTVEADMAVRLAATQLVQYNPAGAYTGTTPGVVFGRMGGSPDNLIAINIYDDQRDRSDRSPDVYVQIRFRTSGADPRTTNALADAVFLAIHDTSNVTWGDTNILHCRRVVRAPIGADDNNRYERADSYRLTLNPSRSNTP